MSSIIAPAGHSEHSKHSGPSSPVQGGWYMQQVLDHTSVLRFPEARFGVRESNISPFRRAVCGDLTSALNFAPPNNDLLPTLARRKSKDETEALRADPQKLAQYDFAATCAADAGYLRRFAARVEAGADAISDPAPGAWQ